MMKRSTVGLAAVAWLSLACAGGMAREDDTAAAQQDTTDVAAQQDTAQVQEPPPGYSGMEQDTTGVEHQPTAVDTFLNEQGTGVPTDTMGYGGLEHPDTSGAAAGDSGTTDSTSTMDPSGQTTDSTSTTGWGADTTGAMGADTAGTSGWDSTGQQ